ncbi:hypothetical protein [Oligosphaera ethanolica]|uniref:Uncharacterized protein n=1 Tax=Oligosphaera ethanolica TaxID=760260 RepID=A0AAE3VDG9_9BACT|nr:hypothetical protein [Oligosphaera ethanolica]MDQ0288376.1 hypothetical protein [Oligosphaera ethanolica]
MKQQVPWIPLNAEHRFHRSNHLVGENTGDNLPETHGQSPPSHSTLITADLRGSGVIAGPE